jgi:glycosyltransferase involved in cell wall biosynthesis
MAPIGSSEVPTGNPTKNEEATRTTGAGALSAPSSMSLETAAALILGARLFDKEWYQVQVDGKFASAREACLHYLSRGRRVGFSPHPLFIPSWVDAEWRTSAIDPLVKYLSDPKLNRHAQTHPFFNPAHLDSRMRESMDRDWGALATFLSLAGPSTPLPCDPESPLDVSAVTLPVLRSMLIDESRNWRARELAYLPLKGSSVEPLAPADLPRLLERFEDSSEVRPRVSIIMPTWNRAAKLRAAIESVQRQSYPEWELIIADDGSVDDTRLAVLEEAQRDSRLIYLDLPHRGVSAARNKALEAASGTYVAFLDSDKEWDPDFLLVMVSSMEDAGLDAAASACEVQKGDRSFFRSVQPTPESLAIGNSIDQTALVLTAKVLERAGGFDETLRRAVDYDLILSVSEVTDIRLIPFVGVRYSEDDSDPNRISEAESVAWNFFVSDRRKWNRFDAAIQPTIVEGRLTVIVDSVASYGEARLVIENLAAHRGDIDVEIILLLSSNGWAEVCSMAPLKLAGLPVRFVYQNPTGVVRPLIVNDAVRQASGEFIMLMHSGQRFISGSLDNFVTNLQTSGSEVSHPVVLGRTRLIDNAGVVYSGLGSDPMALLKGVPLDGLNISVPMHTPGAPLPLITRTYAARKVKGINTKLKALWADIDFSQNLAALGTGSVFIDSSIVIQQSKPTSFDPQANALADIRMFRELWPQNPRGSEDAVLCTGLQPSGIAGFSAASNPHEPKLWPQLNFTRPRINVFEAAPRLRWAIKSAAPADDRSLLWGDFHFANSLAKALRGLGQFVIVDYQENSSRQTSGLDDIVLNLRGLRDIALPSNTLNLLWVISHPDDVTAAEVSKYHIAYAASNSWADSQTEQWGLRIRPLLQCTDSELFYPDFDPEIAAANALLFVGNSRNVYRPAPWNAAKAGLPIQIYGDGWSDLVPEKAIGGEYIPNDELRRYYSSAGITLNDHWPDMRNQGFISNRIFDIVASGGRVLTDDVTGLGDVFGPEVQVFRSPVSLISILKSSNGSDFSVLNESTAASERIRQHHSFDARAQTLLTDSLSYLRANSTEARIDEC